MFPVLLNYRHELLLEDLEMDAQLQRTATAVCSRSADLGEVLATARRVDPGDYDRWYSERAALAEKTTSMFDQDDSTRILTADPEMDAVLQRRLEDPRKREWYGARMATLGAKSLGEFFHLQPACTVQDRVQGIRCPTW
jgi:hypothetical protein